MVSPLQWCHKRRDDLSNHQRLDCLLNRLYRRTWKKTPKLCVTGLCEGNSPVPGEFPSRRPSNKENISIWWRHHDRKVAKQCIFSCLKSSLDQCVNFRQKIYAGHIVSTIVQIKVVFVLFYLCFKAKIVIMTPNDRYCEFVENTECPKVSRSFVVYSHCAGRWYTGINTHKFGKQIVFFVSLMDSKLKPIEFRALGGAVEIVVTKLYKGAEYLLKNDSIYKGPHLVCFFVWKIKYCTSILRKILKLPLKDTTHNVNYVDMRIMI